MRGSEVSPLHGAPRALAAPRVTMVVAQFWPILGGAATQARRLAGELVRQGTAVEIWTGLWNRRWPRRDVVDGVTVRRLGWSVPLPLIRLRRYAFMVALFWRLLRERASYDVVHVHQVLYPAFVAAVAAKIAGKPSLARVSSTGSTSELRVLGGAGLGFQLAITRRLLTRVVAVSTEAEVEYLRGGWRREQLVRIPNGVSVPERPRPAPPLPPLRALYLGGLRREKKVDILLRAWHAAGTPGVLTIAGDGPERRHLEALAGCSGGSVEFVGESAVADALVANNHVLVLASDAEGMSNALLEGMAAGRACVATWVGGNIDLLGPELAGPPPHGTHSVGSAGILVLPGDVDGLASAFRQLYSDPDLVQHLGQSAFRRCRERFTLASVTGRYRDLYDALVASPARQSARC